MANQYSNVPWQNRFWASVNKDGPTPSHVTEIGQCWQWEGSKRNIGYGRINVDRVTWLTHRLSWVLHHGPIPDGMQVCHKCDNPSCVNPDHLFVGTPRQNKQDCIAKGRAIFHGGSSKGSTNPRAKLVDEQVIAMRQRASSGSQIAALAREYGVSKQVAWRIVHRKSWQHL